MASLIGISIDVLGKIDPDQTHSNQYRIATRGDDPRWPYWLENQDGEGMSLSQQDLFQLLHDYFQENF